MNKLKLAFCAVVIGFAAGAYAALTGWENTSVWVSTQGPDYYANGQRVVDGETYALCWSPRTTFGGLTSDGYAVLEDEAVLRFIPGAKDGRCRLIEVQLQPALAKTSGYYFLYLLDTRDANGVPQGLKGIRGSVATTGTSPASDDALDSGASLLSGATLVTSAAGGAIAWNASDTTGIGNPGVTRIEIVDGKVRVYIRDMDPSVLYNVMYGATPNAIDKYLLAKPLSAGDNGRLIDVGRAGVSGFFKVVRQPLDR